MGREKNREMEKRSRLHLFGKKSLEYRWMITKTIPTWH